MKKVMSKIWSKKGPILYVGSLLALFAIGFSFAYWTKSATQSGTISEKTGCFNISYKENTTSFTQNNFFPQSDEDGKKNDPYTITIENTCQTYSKYDIVLNVLGTSTVNDQYIKANVGSGTSASGSIKKLPEYTTQTSKYYSSSSNTYKQTAYVIYSGALRGGQKVTHKVRTWMDSEAPTIANNTTMRFDSKISVQASAAKNIRLAGLIKSEPIVTSGDGLYKAQGDTITLDSKPTFYFKGKNVNNYLKIGSDIFRIVRINEDETIRIVAASSNGATVFSRSGSSTLPTSDYGSTVGGQAYDLYSRLSQNNAIFVDGKFCVDTQTSPVSSFRCSNPVLRRYGLITLNEFYNAGGKDSYLFTGNTFWTITPASNTEINIIYWTEYNGSIYLTRSASDGIPETYPVFNLNEDVRVSKGSGTSSDPYIIDAY